MERQVKTTKIYFMVGKARSGKTTAVQILKEEYEKANKKVATLNYAHYIKDYLALYFNWDGREETKPRELLDQLGDFIRNDLKKQYFFINRINEDIEILSYFFDIIIVGDARLTIELENAKRMFTDKAIFVKIKRSNYESDLTELQKHHKTEVDLDNYDNFDYVIDNDESIENLRSELINIINQEEKQ